MGTRDDANAGAPPRGTGLRQLLALGRRASCGVESYVPKESDIAGFEIAGT